MSFPQLFDEEGYINLHGIFSVFSARIVLQGLVCPLGSRHVNKHNHYFSCILWYFNLRCTREAIIVSSIVKGPPKVKMQTLLHETTKNYILTASVSLSTPKVNICSMYPQRRVTVPFKMLVINLINLSKKLCIHDPARTSII